MNRKYLRYDEQSTYSQLQAIAQANGYFIVVRPDKFLLYRKANPKNVYVGSRQKLAALKQLMNKCFKVVS